MFACLGRVELFKDLIGGSRGIGVQIPLGKAIAPHYDLFPKFI